MPARCNRALAPTRAALIINREPREVQLGEANQLKLTSVCKKNKISEKHDRTVKKRNEENPTGFRCILYQIIAVV